MDLVDPMDPMDPVDPVDPMVNMVNVVDMVNVVNMVIVIRPHIRLFWPIGSLCLGHTPPPARGTRRGINPPCPFQPLEKDHFAILARLLLPSRRPAQML
jgi:hypothetical protein